MEFIVHPLFLSLCILLPSAIQPAVNKIDFVVQHVNPILVDLDDTVAKPYRGYASEYYKKTTTFNIGREIDTGPGDRGSEVTDPGAGPIDNDNTAFPLGSTVSYTISDSYDRININLAGGNEQKERIGAFYAEAVHDGNTVKITTVIRPTQANIKPQADTITVSVGDDVVLHVTPDSNTPENSLRWRHNEVFNREWDGMATVTITNVRKADAGIYECHRDGRRQYGVHAIMRLIVRACPKGKYGVDCSDDCQTCYNGGMCEEETGVCICPTGFQRERCETPCGNNAFGATCSITCSQNANGSCREKIFCVPDPVGCSCAAGFMGESCDIECSGLSYGTNCDRTCHCGAADCDNARGCGAGAICDTGYGGIGCQVSTSCQAGYFGELCDRQCHCKNYNTCSKATGVCADYQCADEWGGNDCQQALPALYEFNPHVEVGETSLKIQWNAWDENIDYGTGPAEKYRLYLAQQGQPLEMVDEGTNTNADVTGLQYGTPYEYGVRILRTIHDKQYEGNLGPLGTSTTTCGVPFEAPTITNITVEGPHSVQLEWSTSEGNDWLKCSSIAAFIITYGTGLEMRINDGTARNTSIVNLMPCTEYQFNIQAENKDHVGPKSSPELAATGPSKVQSMTITAISSESMYVFWTPPADCTVTDYIVSHQLILLDQCIPVRELPIKRLVEGTGISIPGLKGYSTYEVVVYARINGVPGEKQNNSDTTDEMVPAGSPDNVTHTVHHNEPIMTLYWDPPICGSRGGVITKYEYVFGLDIEGGDVQYGSTDPDQHMVVFDNLDYYKEYQFQVRACTAPGSGPYSELSNVTTPESYPDAAPTNIESDEQGVKGQLRFTWNLPPEDDRNGEIIFYEYEFDTKSQVQLWDWFRNGLTSEAFAIFEGLPHYTEFHFRVKAHTSVGPGPFSNYVIARTLPSEPSAPLNLQIVRSFTTQIQLQWKRPTDLNGILFAYIITGKNGDDVERTEVTNNIDADLLVEFLTDLKSGRDYAITITGITNGGQGPESNEVVGATLKSEENGLDDTALITGFSVTIGILVILLVFAIVAWRTQMCISHHREEGKESRTTAKKQDSAGDLPSEGYVRYLPPLNKSDMEYQELQDQVASNNPPTKHAYANTMMKADGLEGTNDESNYEEIPHGNNHDNDANEADTAFC